MANQPVGPGIGAGLAGAFTSGSQASQSVMGSGAVGGFVAGTVIASGIGKALMTGLANPLTAIPTAIFATVGAFTGLTKVTKDLAQSFAEFSPSLTGMFAMAEVRQIMRSQRVGEAIAPSVGPLIDSIENLKDVFEPMLIDIIKGTADISRGFVDVVAAGTEWFGKFWEDAEGHVGPIKATLKEIYAFLTGKEWKDEPADKAIHLGPGWGIIDPKRPAAFRPQGP